MKDVALRGSSSLDHWGGPCVQLQVALEEVGVGVGAGGEERTGSQGERRQGCKDQPGLQA